MKRLVLFLFLIFIAGSTRAQKKTGSKNITSGDFENTAPADPHKSYKVTHGPYLQDMSETGVTFVWTTNREGIAWVELMSADSTSFYRVERPRYFATSNGLKTVSTIHKVHIGHLQPGKRYRYRIFSQEVLSHKGIDVRYGEVVATRVFQRVPPKFTTNDYSKENISFLMLNDIHERNEVLKNLLKGMSRENTDFVLFNGDMVNSSRSEEQMFASFMDTAVHLFASQIPMYYARGNHETRGPFAGAFSEYFPGPQGKLYYMFRQGPVCFIVLDSGEDKPDSDIEYSGITAFDAYRDEEAEWLKNAVHSKTFLDAPFKVVVAHIPPLGGWHGEIEIADKFMPLLNEAKIDLMLCAHLHRYLRRNAEPGVHNFPIVVNSNNTVLKAKANSRELKIEIVDLKGVVIDSLTVHPH